MIPPSLARFPLLFALTPGALAQPSRDLAIDEHRSAHFEPRDNRLTLVTGGVSREIDLLAAGWIFRYEGMQLAEDTGHLWLFGGGHNWGGVARIDTASAEIEWLDWSHREALSPDHRHVAYGYVGNGALVFVDNALVYPALVPHLAWGRHQGGRGDEAGNGEMRTASGAMPQSFIPAGFPFRHVIIDCDLAWLDSETLSFIVEEDFLTPRNPPTGRWFGFSPGVNTPRTRTVEITVTVPLSGKLTVQRHALERPVVDELAVRNHLAVEARNLRWREPWNYSPPLALADMRAHRPPPEQARLFLWPEDSLAMLASPDLQANLTHLVAWGITVPPGGWASLREMRALRSLTLDEVPMSDDAWQVIGGLENLEEIEIRGVEVSDAGAEHLRELRHLRSLRLGHGLTDDGLRTLAELASLETLGVNARDEGWSSVVSPGITGEGLAALAPLRRLRTLELPATGIRTEGLSALASFPSLEELDLSESRVRADEASALAEVPSLRTLRVDGVACYGEGFPRTISQLASLERIHLDRTGLTDLPASASGEALFPWPHLEWLQLNGVAYTMEVVEPGGSLEPGPRWVRWDD